jgi:hypothetical protein
LERSDSRFGFHEWEYDHEVSHDDVPSGNAIQSDHTHERDIAHLDFSPLIYIVAYVLLNESVNENVIDTSLGNVFDDFYGIHRMNPGFVSDV